MQNISSKQILLIGGGIIIIVGVIGLSIYTVKKDSRENNDSLAPVATTSTGLSDFTLAHPEIIPQMSVAASSIVVSGSGATTLKEPTLSPQQIQKVKAASTASPEIKRPVRTAEQQKLLDSMSVQ